MALSRFQPGLALLKAWFWAASLPVINLWAVVFERLIFKAANPWAACFGRRFF
jgi:hypothetical protein